VLAHLDLVKQVAGIVKRRVPPQIEVDDLESAGMLGLLSAATAFDRARGIAFGAFARRRIHGAMLDYLRDNDSLTRHERHLVRTGELRVFELQLHADNPEFRRIAEAVDARPLPDATCAALLQAEHVRREVARLPKRERYVIEQHFARGRLLADIGTDLRIGQARVSQLKAQALGRLRRWLAC
jgi:RNA polymerase sigma factor for flagellar operon FliA